MRRMVWRNGLFIGAVATLAACGKKEAQPEVPARATEHAKISVGHPPAPADSDKAQSNTRGLPPGYHAVLDRADAKISDISYAESTPGRWEVKTGPAHILYSAADTVTSPSYKLTATFEQLEKPAHPEAYGVIWGGKALDNPAKQQYIYFIVRGTGEYAVKVRNGSATRTITDWTKVPALAHEDAAGKALYGIQVDVDGNVAKISVNGMPVTTVSEKNLPMRGIGGVRINHNLHLIVTPASITR